MADAAEPAQQTARSTPTEGVATPLVIEIGGARILVGSGFERATLSSLLEVLSARGGSQ